MCNPHQKRSDTRRMQDWYNNFLYGTSMSQYLPTRNFDEIEITEGNEKKLKSLSDSKDDYKRGYFIECDLE